MGPSWVQILIVVVAVVLLLGRGKIASLMSEVAQGIRSFRKGMQEGDIPDEPNNALEADFSTNTAQENDKKPAETEKSPATKAKD